MCQRTDLRLGAHVLERTVVPRLDDLFRDGYLPTSHLRHGDLRPLSDMRRIGDVQLVSHLR